MQAASLQRKEKNQSSLKNKALMYSESGGTKIEKGLKSQPVLPPFLQSSFSYERRAGNNEKKVKLHNNLTLNGLKFLSSEGRAPSSSTLDDAWNSWEHKEAKQHSEVAVPLGSHSDNSYRCEMPVSSDMQSRINNLRPNGKKLPVYLRHSMEHLLNHNFRDVRLHTDKHADRLNRSFNAQAFTSGSDIFFRDSYYQPGTSQGLKLLTHELAHVVQKDFGTGLPLLKRTQFGSSVRFNTLPGPTPRARVIGTHSDESIAAALYGDDSVPVQHLESDSSTILICTERLLPQWQPYFTESDQEDVSQLSYEEKRSIGFDTFLGVLPIELVRQLFYLALGILAMAVGISIIFSLVPASWVAFIQGCIAALSVIAGIYFVVSALDTAVSGWVHFTSNVEAATRQSQLESAGIILGHDIALAVRNFLGGILAFYGALRLGTGSGRAAAGGGTRQSFLWGLAQRALGVRTGASGNRPPTGLQAWASRWLVILNMSLGRGTHRAVDPSNPAPYSASSMHSGSPRGTIRLGHSQGTPRQPVAGSSQPSTPSSVPQTSSPATVSPGHTPSNSLQPGVLPTASTIATGAISAAESPAEIVSPSSPQAETWIHGAVTITDPAHHNLDIRVYRNDELVTEFHEVSGEMTQADMGMGRFGQWIVHTEPKAINRIHEMGINLDENTVIHMRGESNPCPTCDRFLTQVHYETGVQIRYAWSQARRGGAMMEEQGMIQYDLDRLWNNLRPGEEAVPELEDILEYFAGRGD